jgi:hypothetical protein
MIVEMGIMRKMLFATVAVMFTTSVNAFGEMPDEYIGEWCHAEDRGQTQIYSRAPSPNCNKQIVRKLIITEMGLLMPGKATWSYLRCSSRF